MASEKARHSWARPSEEGEDTSLSDNGSALEVRSVDEQPPAYTGDYENGESSSAAPPAPASSSSQSFAGDQKQPLQPQLQPQYQHDRQQYHYQQQSLSQKPVAIPAIGSSFDSPFIRAYAPVLKDYKLPQEVFLSFLDRLNKAIANSPPLQVLDATGGLLSSVPVLFPLHWIGSAVSGIANLGNMGVSKSRTDSMIREANRDIFGPRGLRIEIAKLDALAHIAKIPILGSQGKISRQSPLFQQLTMQQQQQQSGISPATNQSVDTEENARDYNQRRIRILQPWIADLEFDILPWTTQSKLTRFNAALKKYNNDPGESQSRRERRRGKDKDRKLADDDTREEEDDDAFRKCLWLIIRDAEGLDVPRQ